MRAVGVFDQARLAPLAQLGLDATIILHPNGAEAYFEIWKAGLPTMTEPPTRVGGAVPRRCASRDDGGTLRFTP